MHRWNHHCASRIRFIILVIVVLITKIPLYAQEQSGSQEDTPGSQPYHLSDVVYHIEGNTKPYALARLLDISTGRLFDSFQDLNIYISEKERILKGNRVFTADSYIDYVLLAPDGETPPGEGTPRPIDVILHVYAYDTWTALAVPFPKYTESEGLSLALRYKDFNFLGSLNPITASLDYYVVTQIFDAGIAFNVYPYVVGTMWDTSLSAYIRYEPSEGLHFYDSTASLSTTYTQDQWSFIPSLSYTYTDAYKEHKLTLLQTCTYVFGRSYNWKTGVQTGYVLDSIASVPHKWTNNLYLSSSFSLARLPSNAMLTLHLRPNLFSNFDLQTFSIYDAGISSTASLGFSAVDWRGNFRSGGSFSIAETSTYYVIQPSPSHFYDLLADLNASFFTSFNNLIGIDFRFVSRWNAAWSLSGDTTNKTAIEWGGYLRGVPDSLYGDVAMVTNLQFPINFAQGKFFQWSKLEAEVFLIPFIDAGYVRQSPSDPLWQSSDFYLTGGAEIVVFPLYARSFTYRLSLGYNFLDALVSSGFVMDNAELWLGLGLHF